MFPFPLQMQGRSNEILLLYFKQGYADETSTPAIFASHIPLPNFPYLVYAACVAQGTYLREAVWRTVMTTKLGNASARRPGTLPVNHSKSSKFSHRPPCGRGRATLNFPTAVPSPSHVVWPFCFAFFFSHFDGLPPQRNVTTFQTYC